MRPEATQVLSVVEMFQLISKQTRDVIIFMDGQGIVTYVSSALCQTLGYPPEDWVGRPILPYFHPDDVLQVMLFQQRILRNEVDSHLVTRIRHKDGHYIWFEGTMNMIEDAHNRVHMGGIWRDITEQRELTDKLNDAFRIAGLGHWEWDILNNTVHWSDTMYQLCGIDHQTTITLGMATMLIGSRSEITAEEILAYALSSGGSYKGETTISMADGSVRQIAFQGQVKFEAETPTRIVGTVLDITERKAMLGMLLEAEKLAVVGQLAAGIAHEIRNPMTVIQGYAKLLQEGATAADASRFVEMILTEGTRINGVLSDLLLLAKPQMRSLIPFTLDGIVQQSIDFLTPEATKQGVLLTPTALIQTPIMGDPNQMKQVCLNVLLNAIEAMPNGGRVYISCVPVEGFVALEVRDEGIGIDDERIAKLGEPFFTTKEKGTGLGLMVCKRIVELHQGTFTISSKLGHGTTIRIQLPANDRHTS